MQYVTTLESEHGTKFDVIKHDNQTYFDYSAFKLMCTSEVQGKLNKMIVTVFVNYAGEKLERRLISFDNFKGVAQTYTGVCQITRLLHRLEKELKPLDEVYAHVRAQPKQIPNVQTPTVQETNVAEIETQIKKLTIEQTIRNTEIQIKDLELAIKRHELSIAKAKVKLEQV